MHSDQNRFSRSEGGKGQVAELRRAVHDDDVISVIHGDQRIA